MKYRNGFSLLEIILVIAIIGVLAAIIALPFSKFRQTQALQNTTNAIVALLNEARTKTLAGANDTSYGVKIESGQATLFQGSAYVSSDPTNEVLTFETPVTVSTISLNGGGSEIKFDRLKGTTSQYGTLTVTLPTAVTHVITVTATGSVMRN